MAIICRRCARDKQMQGLPPVRTVKAPCEFCGGQDEDPKGRNYEVANMAVPGNASDPNVIREREEAEAG